MKNYYYKSLVATAILTTLSQHAAFATELDKVYSSQDTWVNVNHGGNTEIRGDITAMKIDQNNTGFIQFVIDPGTIPAGEVIDKVMLEMKVTGKNPILDTYIATITDPDVVWDETVVNEQDWPFVIGDKIPGASIASDPTSDPASWTMQKGTKHQFDISSAINGAGTYTFNVDSENTDLVDRKWATGSHSSDLSTQLGRPALIITTKLAAASDSTPPVFADIAPIEINATGTKTDISALININATDDTDGEVAAIITSDSSLISGTHTVSLVATDVAANEATKDITVNITPLIVLTAPETIELPPGETASASVALSGPAVSYPATIDYTIAGDATNDTSGTLTFTAQDFADEQNVDIVIKADALGKATAVLTLTAVSNVQANNETVTVTSFDGNLPPTVSLTLTQASETIATINADTANSIPYIDATKGDVTVTVAVADFNNGDTHALNWTDTSEALAATGTSFIFSPTELSGNFTLAVSATESNTTDSFSTSLQAQVRIIATALPDLVAEADSDNDGISDTDEGYKDSDGDGIVDYLDDNADTTQLPLAAGQKSLQTLPNLTLSLGSVSDVQGIDAKSAVITLADLAASVAADGADTTDSGFLPLEGASLFNFTVSGLTGGATAPIVYPLPKGIVISEKTEYRKYTPLVGWTTFVSDADNKIASAEKDASGNCPAPESDLYIDGLTAGDNCIQLTIKDGGIYDADGIENSSIEDPGVLAESFKVIQWSTDNIALPASNVNEGSSVIIKDDLTAYIGDADPTTLTFTVTSDASWLSVDEAGVLTADVSKLASGEHSATVSFNDNKTQTGDTKVSVSVTFNNAPTLAAIALPSAARNEVYAANIAEQISDADGHTYTVEKVSGPYWLNISETGELSGTPRNADIGDNSFSIAITDDKGAKSINTIAVTVVDNGERASDAGSFSAGLLAILGLVSLRRRKLK